MAEKVTIGNCELWHGDCLNIISQISGVDVVLTDPLYGTKTDQRGESFMVGEFSNVLPIALPLLHAAMKTDGAFYCFTSWAQMSEWLLRFQQYFKLQNILVWDKKRHSGCYSPSSWQFTWEGVFFGIKGKRKIRKYLRDVLVSEETGKRIAMQKPIDVLVQMIEASCDEGDLVFDPFMGSGSSGVAAAKSGRRSAFQYTFVLARRLSVPFRMLPLRIRLSPQLSFLLLLRSFFRLARVHRLSKNPFAVTHPQNRRVNLSAVFQNRHAARLPRVGVIGREYLDAHQAVTLRVKRVK